MALMEAASTSEMSINFYQISWYYDPEDSHVYIHHCETLKSYLTEQLLRL
jgi:hypothetical protein